MSTEPTEIEVLRARIERADKALADALDVITGWCRPDLWGDLPTIERLCYKALDILREQDSTEAPDDLPQPATPSMNLIHPERRGLLETTLGKKILGNRRVKRHMARLWNSEN